MSAGPCELSASASEALIALDRAGLGRSLRCVERTGPARVSVDGREVVSFASCDYLGLSSHPALAEAAARAARERGTSTGSARLLAGHDHEVAALEAELAAFFGAPAALVFGSGYLANLGTVTGLARGGDLLVSDRLVHASTVDACRLSGAQVQVVPHNDAAAVARALGARDPGVRALVLVEGVYSMDGDLAPLPELAGACREHGAHLLVDDAHGLGVVGPQGRGAAAALGVAADCAAQVGNLGKALGSYGAFVLLDEVLRELLLSTARSFVFTCALPPPVVAAARSALAVLRSPEDAWRVSAAQDRAALLRRALLERGVPLVADAPLARGLPLAGAAPAAGGVPLARGVPLAAGTPTGDGDSGPPTASDATARDDVGQARSADAIPTPIVPVLIGDGERALLLSARLLERGWLAPAVRAPTVPPGGERLRLTVSAEHQPEHCVALADDLAELLGA